MQEFYELFREHAAAEYPRESCGVVVENPRAGRVYVKLRNIADGQAHFIADPRDLRSAENIGEIVAIVHSHPNIAADPSEADRVMMERWSVPWFIVNWPTGEIREHRPSGYRAPLIGRTFSHGVLDCFTLIRDYYSQILRIELPDFERPDDWWNKGANLYLDNFVKAGFVEVSDGPREHDVLLIQLRSPVPNHGAIYLGNDIILHHVMNRLSRREGYSGFWKRNTAKIVRHKKLC